MIGTRWTENFAVTDDDLDFIMNLMLERETPMKTKDITMVLLEERLQAERSKLEEQYEGTQFYTPAQKYEVGNRLVFTEMELATATVTDVRDGVNDDYGDFDVIAVKFDDDSLNQPNKHREFAANLAAAHKLADVAEQGNPLSTEDELTPEQIIVQTRGAVLYKVRDALKEHPALERVAGFWFPRELVMEFDIGAMHLSEAVLDMNGGGPLTPNEIIEQIGGLGDAPLQLQIFSLNLALNEDDRFAEVGPSGEVQWYLKRMMPDDVQRVPPVLDYKPIPYDEEILSDELFDVETELDDEHTPIDFEGRLRKAASTLIYPHRRAGTLPLNAKNRALFPHARTPIIHVELIDTIDDEVYSGWVVHQHKYVYGLQEYYEKHKLPVGTYVTVERGDNPGQILISYNNYKPRKEWIRVLAPNNSYQVSYENKKRAIGAEYDEFLVIGVEDIEAVDKLAESYKNKKLDVILRELIAEMSKLSPQGTVHAVTLYSAVNMLRRCAPGPIFATLTSHPDFEDVGDQYWKLRS